MKHTEEVINHSIDNQVSLLDAYIALCDEKFGNLESELFKLKSDATKLYNEHA